MKQIYCLLRVLGVQVLLAAPVAALAQKAPAPPLTLGKISPAECAALRELHPRAAAKCGEMLVLSRK